MPSNLQKALNEGKFVVTAELGPPRGCDISIIEKKAALLKGIVDAVNITDNQTAMVRMSSMAASAALVNLGLEPVMQMVTRDRNRIACQSDILGAAALGIKNILCLSGDHQKFGNQPGAKNVFDIDSIQLASIFRRMRDEGKILDNEDELQGNPDLFIGAAVNPFAEPEEFRPLRFKKKVQAGVQFVQTQCIYDVERFKEYMKQVRDLGIHEECYILAGVTPLKSSGMARFMKRNVSGVIVPEDVEKRMDAAPKGSAADEGIKLCCEQIHELSSIEGVHGIHIMAIEWEDRVEEIIKVAGLVPACQCQLEE
jgi:methylenetetrahydrofolate reductase (NADPH)